MDQAINQSPARRKEAHSSIPDSSIPDSFILNSSIPNRILMTADTVGGVWTYALELIRALQPYGVEVGLATMGAFLTEEQRAEAARLDNLDVFAGSFKLEWMDDPWQDVLEAGKWLLELEQQWKPDIIHLNGYAHGSLPFRAPKLIVAHSCVLSWWHDVKGENAPREWDCYRQEVHTGLSGADMVIAPTHAMRNALKQHYGSFRQCEVVPNGRSPELFRPDNKEPFLITAGRLWDEAKNISMLENAAPHISWPIYVAGESCHPSGGSIAPQHTRSLGRLPAHELADWLSRASIYALPARYEPFGLSILEAALCRCALVIGDIPSLREVWGTAALYVPPDDKDLLQATVNVLIADTEWREEMAERALCHAREYTLERKAAGYLAAYAKIMGKNSATNSRQ